MLEFPELTPTWMEVLIAAGTLYSLEDRSGTWVAPPTAGCAATCWRSFWMISCGGKKDDNLNFKRSSDICDIAEMCDCRQMINLREVTYSQNVGHRLHGYNHRQSPQLTNLLIVIQFQTGSLLYSLYLKWKEKMKSIYMELIAVDSSSFRIF